MPIRILCAVVFGLLLSLAFEPVAQPVVIPVAVSGYVLVVRGLGPGRAWLPALCFGAAFFFTHTWWMRAVADAAWLGLGTGESLFYGFLGPVVAVLLRHRSWPVTVAAAWVSVEIIRSSWPFSGMPWGRLSFATVDTVLADSLPYIGQIGVSLLLALSGTLLAWLVVSRGRTRGIAAGSLVALVAIIAVPVLAPYQLSSHGTATVAAVQGDVPGPGNDILWDHRQVTRNHVEATIDLADRVAAGSVEQPDFVVWPENSTAVDPFADRSTNDGITEAVEAIGVPVLVGAIVDGAPGKVLNQGIVWDPVTGAGERYTKWHPVPYGEYIPFRKHLNLNFGELARIKRDMVAGTRTTPIALGPARLANAICFDIAYDDGIYAQIEAGADLLVVQTSNALFIHTDQIDQQFAITRLRAIETGKATVVAAPNGVTGIISPDGEVQAVAEPRTTSVLVEQMDLRAGVTPGVRLAPWLGWGAHLLTWLTLAALLVRQRLAYRQSFPSSTPEQ